ncbi:UbiX family flavin prenyltransferase [Candidatus Bathyarchaeota archaeon]|nr:UbiX family flavin prenyltransferase [Candidatus Bathyarchaeota archaeon]
MKLTIAITGASGVIYGKRLLEELKAKSIETNLVISKAAQKIINIELKISEKNFRKLANNVYDPEDWNSPIVSGSFKNDGMIIVPCSMKTLAGIASGYAENVILRAADVTLKENKKLILVPRETPLNNIHLDNMLKLSKMGAIIVPSMPAFYQNPQTIKELVDFVVGRILDQLNIQHSLYKRWNEISPKS